MANIKHIPWTQLNCGTGSAGHPYPGVYVCDLDAEKPSSGLVEGDIVITKDLDKFYIASSPTTLQEIGSGGGGGVAWREFTLLADSAGVTMTNIGTAFVQVGVNSLRSKVDMTGFTDCRVVAGVNKVGSGTQDWKIQYSTDEAAWSDLTPAISDAGAAGEKLLVGAFGAIPAGAKADVFIRLVGKSTTAADDPVVKSCKLHIK
jgi:hypothetical protein